MKACVHCNHAVAQGDRHAVMSCPPRALGRNSRKARQRRKDKKRRKRDAALNPTRGVTVAGTGKPKGAEK